MNVRDELEYTLGKDLPNSKVFESDEAFAAFYAAKKFCQEQGFSVGRMQSDHPIGIRRGKWNIQKWCNLSRDDRKLMDGAIVGIDKRNGPVTVLYSEEIG